MDEEFGIGINLLLCHNPASRTPGFLEDLQEMFDRAAVFRCRLEICQYVTPPQCHRWWDLLQLPGDTVLGIIPGGWLLSRRFPNNAPRVVFIYCFLWFQILSQHSSPGQTECNFSICVTVFFILLVISKLIQLPRKDSVYIVIPYYHSCKFRVILCPLEGC